MTVRVDPADEAEAAVWGTTLDAARLLKGLPWVLIGAQMVRLLELERGRPSGRTTRDVDVVVDTRVVVGATRIAADRLIRAGFVVFGEHPYRFVRGGEWIDLLAPDGLGDRADLTTVEPFRTTQIPGASMALRTCRVLQVSVPGIGSERIPVPTVAGAILLKVKAHQARAERRDLEDIVRLLVLVDDVEAGRQQLTAAERKALGSVAPLRDAGSSAWSAAADPDEARLAFARLSE